MVRTGIALISRFAAMRRSVLWVAIGVALLGLAASSSIRVPIYGDDFRLAQQMYATFDGSLWTALTTSWNTEWQLNRFNPAGRWFALTYHFLAYDVSATVGMSIHWFYRAGAFLLLCLLVAAAAFCLRAAFLMMSNEGHERDGARTFAWTAALVAVTMQVHPWSHDPLLTISEIGLTTGALSFVYLGVVFRIASRGASTARIVWLGALACFGTMFYESFVAAVVAAAVVWLWCTARAIRNNPVVDLRRLLSILLVAVALPLLIFVGGRTYVRSMGLPSYSGTALEISADGLRPFTVLAAAMLPGSAWPRSLQDASALVIAPAIVVALGIALLLGLLTWMSWRQPSARLAFRRRAWIPVGVFCVFVCAMLAMHAFTQKYIDEITRLGDVYLSYTTLLAVTGMTILTVILTVPHRLALVLAALPLLGAFVVTQQIANWTVAETANVELTDNATLAWMSVKPAPSAERCDALQAWVDSANWPAYYRAAVVEGVNENYSRRFGEPFCSVFHE